MKTDAVIGSIGLLLLFIAATKQMKKTALGRWQWLIRYDKYRASANVSEARKPLGRNGCRILMLAGVAPRLL